MIQKLVPHKKLHYTTWAIRLIFKIERKTSKIYFKQTNYKHGKGPLVSTSLVYSSNYYFAGMMYTWNIIYGCCQIDLLISHKMMIPRITLHSLQLQP